GKTATFPQLDEPATTLLPKREHVGRCVRQPVAGLPGSTFRRALFFLIPVARQPSSAPSCPFTSKRQIEMNRTLFLAASLLCTSAVLAGEKVAVPTDEAREASTARVSEVFESDFKEAKSPQQKLELAKKLLELGKETKDDDVGQ